MYTSILTLPIICMFMYSAMDAMGDKINSKRIAKEAGCYVIPGFEGTLIMTYIHTCTHLYACIRLHEYGCDDTYIRVYVHSCIHMYVHTHNV